ncbi:Oidioi.mRNA.OKI2018_I69.PAR.g9799.t1.cds [Oikopleura dioica]|uniref:Oidioi.mRNA.OKI2018_I69.PAR.g9799.t1.cds n=1 Tax=Oikopleura dioica TaxID=34765 RepID=A0ABN7RMB9_OIKDI|nr:Oidioi.mRNA.OKI2018_I69.PAR.g9799.t1.cds [Oikopleura dioica]
MNNALVNGGCFVRLSILDNIASFWELNPKTNRIRVIAPKTKAEPYPDYETEEDTSARTIAGICNREIPYGSDRATRKSRKRSVSESESESESERESESVEFSNSEDEEEFHIKKLEQEAKTRRQKLQARIKRSQLSRKPVTRATSARRESRRGNIRKRRSDSGSASPVVKSKRSNRLEKSNFAEPEPVTKHPRKPLLRPSRLKEYPITSNDYRKWRSAISNASNRDSKRKRAIEFSNSTASDEDTSETESIANSVKSNSRVARINGRRRIREQTPFYNNAYDDADVDRDEDEQLSKRPKRSKRAAGRVTTVRATKQRKLAKPKSQSSSKNAVSPTSSAIKKSHYYDPDGIESRSDEESDEDRLYIDDGDEENESHVGRGGGGGGGGGGADIDNFWG